MDAYRSATGEDAYLVHRSAPFGDSDALAGSRPTIPGALARQWLMVVLVGFLAAATVSSYTLRQAKTYVAGAYIALGQSATPPNPDVGPAADPKDYVESQILVLRSLGVAQMAAVAANVKTGRPAFSASNFSGPHGSVKLATSATHPDVVAVSYRARDPGYAATGANAVVAAYLDSRASTIKGAYSSIIGAMTSTLQAIDAQLATPDVASNAEVAASLVDQRSAVSRASSQALVDERTALSDPPTTLLAHAPTRPANHEVARNTAIGAALGLLAGSIIAYIVEWRQWTAEQARLFAEECLVANREWAEC